MGAKLLSDLSDDALRNVVRFLDSISIGRICLSGSIALNGKLERSRVVEALEIVLETPTPKWPSIVNQLQYLEHLSVCCAINGLYTPITDIIVEKLPKTLRTVKFHFANDFSCFFERDLDACDVDRYNADGIRLKDMSELLPCLEKLEFIGTVVHLPLQDTFLSFLPHTLVQLRLPSNYPISAAMISYMPRTLQVLDFRLRRFGQDWDPDLVVFPPHLDSLTLWVLRSMSILPLLPSSIRTLRFSDLDEDAHVGLDVLYELLPSALTALSCFVNRFNEAFTKALPRSLTELEVDFEEFELEAVKHLPPNLLVWDTPFLFSTLDTLLWTWDLLPPTIQKVPKLLLTPETLPDAETWKSLPRGLQYLSLDLEEPEWSENSIKILPPCLEQLAIDDSSYKMGNFDWTPAFPHLTSLTVYRPLCTPEMAEHIQKLDSLLFLVYMTKGRQIQPSLFLHLPPALTSLETDVGCDDNFLNMPKLWPPRMRSLMLSNLGTINFSHFYACLPRTLQQLAIRDQFNPLPYNFTDLPRKLLHCSIMMLEKRLDDQALLALPPALRSLRIFSSDQAIFTARGLMGLPRTLELIKLPEASSTVREAELLPFLQERPCVMFRLGTTSPSFSEDIQKAYERKYLTLGNVKSMYDYRWR